MILKWLGLLIVAGMLLSAFGVQKAEGYGLVAWQVYLWGTLVWSIVHSYWKAHRSSDALEGYKLFEQSQHALTDGDRIEKLEAAVSLYPEPGIRARLAAALYAVQRYEESVPRLRASLELPNLRDVDDLIYKLGFSLLAAKKHEEAISLFEQIDEKDEYEGFLEVLILKARCYFESKQNDMAMAVVKSILAKRGEEAVQAKRKARVLQVRILEATGEVREALGVAKKLLKDVPDSAEAKALVEELEQKVA